MQTLKSVLLAQKTACLANSEKFKAALAPAGGRPGAVMLYVDWGQVYALAFNMGAKAMKLLGTTEALNKLGIDINMLPSPESVTKHLFPSLAVAQTTPGGLVLTSRGPLPSAEVLAPPISAIASAIAAFTAGAEEEKLQPPPPVEKEPATPESKDEKKSKKGP